MTKKKSHSQILNSYTNLVSRVKAEEAYSTSWPESDSSLHELRHEPGRVVSLDDLNHLRDLIHLRDQLILFKHRLPITRSLVFTAPSSHIPKTAYKRTDYNTINELNAGNFSLSLKASENQDLLRYELKVFDILHDLKGLRRVSETLSSHYRFHESLLTQAILILRDVDLIKEAEWNRQMFQHSRPQDQYVFRNGALLLLHLFVWTSNRHFSRTQR